MSNRDSQRYALAHLASHVDGELAGDGARCVTHIAALQDATADSLCFITSPRHFDQLGQCRPGGLLMNPALAKNYGGDKILVEDPRLAYAKLSILFAPAPQNHGIHPSAVIHPEAQLAKSAQVGAHSVIGAHSRLGEQVRIGANVCIGEQVEIGAGSVIENNVTLHGPCWIGRNCIISSGCVVGACGFGYAWDEQADHWQRIEHFGGVRLGDAVELGAGCTIDRGALGDTLLGDGVKLDDQVMIAHNVEIGAHTIIAGCGAIAGSTKIGRYCSFGGVVGINGHVEITDHVTLTGKSVVTNSIRRSGLYSSSVSARAARQGRACRAVFNQQPEVLRRVRQLERTRLLKPDAPASALREAK